MLDVIETTMTGDGGNGPPVPCRIAYVYIFNFRDGVNLIFTVEEAHLPSLIWGNEPLFFANIFLL